MAARRCVREGEERGGGGRDFWCGGIATACGETAETWGAGLAVRGGKGAGFDEMAVAIAGAAVERRSL